MLCTAIEGAPAFPLCDPRKKTTLLKSVATSEHFRIIEAPQLVAQWIVQSGIFKGAATVSNGLTKVVNAESLVFLVGDIVTIPTRVKALKGRVVELLNSRTSEAKTSTARALVNVGHELRRSAAVVAGTVSDWFDACHFANGLKILKAKTVKIIAPAALLANGCGIFSAASNLYDNIAGFEKTQFLKTEDSALSRVMKEVAEDKDRWELVKWGSVLAIHSVAVATILTGVAVASVVPLAITTAIFASRVASFYRGAQLGVLENQAPETIKATQIKR